MVLAAVSLTSGNSTVDGTVFTTAPCTATAGRLTFVYIVATAAAMPNVVPTVVGHGVTYSLVFHPGGAGVTRGMVFASLAASGVGTVTMNYGITLTGCCWAIDEFTGHDARGLEYSVAVTAAGTGTGFTNGPLYDLPAPPSLGGYSGIMLQNVPSGEVLTQRGGFLALGRNGYLTPTTSVATQWKASAVTDAGWSWTTNASGRGAYLLIRPALTGVEGRGMGFMERRRRRI